MDEFFWWGFNDWRGQNESEYDEDEFYYDGLGNYYGPDEDGPLVYEEHVRSIYEVDTQD